MNPYRLKNVFEYLTSNNQLLKKKLKLGTSEIPIPPKRQDVIDIEAINRFNKANPRIDTTSLKPLSVKHSNVRQSNVNEPNEGVIQGAFDTATREAQSEGFPAPSYDKFKSRYLKKNMKADGGMLVQPSDDGSRPGYAKPIKTPTKKELEIAKKVYGSKPEFKDKKGVDLWKAIGTVNRSNIIQKKTTGGTGGIPGGITKQNMLSKDDFIKLVNANKNKTYNQFVELIKNFKTKDGEAFTKNIVADRLRSYNLSGSFKKEPPKGPDNIKKAEAEKKRKSNLKEVDPTKAKGVEDFQYHHVRQIAGGVPLTTDDVLIINKRINSQIGGETNKALNRIAEAIRKNNKLALEAMNAKNEGLALDYMKRSDELNAQAEKIVNSAIDDLPKKYKGYVGFNQFTLPRDEYGLPISNEPIIVKKVGGMPVSKNAVDLTTLDLKQEKEFRKVVRAQAETGKTGKIDLNAAKEKFLTNLDKNKFRRVSTVLINAAKEGGFGEAVQKICMRKKAKKGGRMFLSNGSGCPAADQDPKGFLKSVSESPGLKKFFTSSTGQKLAGAAARVTGNVLNPTTLIGGEVAFVLGDALNNFASGLPLDESFDRAFVFGDFGKFEKNLMNKAKELGYDDNQLNLLQETININKLDNREKKLKYGLDNETPGSEDLIMGFPERLADTKNQLDNSVQNYIGTLDKMGFDLSKDSTYDVGFRYLDNAFKKRTQDQLVEDFKDRERQVDPTKTPFGDFISPAFDLSSYTQPLKYGLDIINPFTKDVPFLSEQQQEAKKLRDMSQEDLDIYNKNRKFTLEDIQSGESPYTRQLMDYLGTDVTGQGFGSQFLAGGGIASLTKTIPPESGPTPHGLPYVYNNVKKI